MTTLDKREWTSNMLFVAERYFDLVTGLGREGYYRYASELWLDSVYRRYRQAAGEREAADILRNARDFIRKRNIPLNNFFGLRRFCAQLISEGTSEVWIQRPLLSRTRASLEESYCLEGRVSILKVISAPRKKTWRLFGKISVFSIVERDDGVIRRRILG